MTGNTLIDLAISIGGVILLVGLARLIFGLQGAALTEAAAADRLAFDEPDFEPAEWLISGTGAIAVNQAGEAALIKPLGDGLVSRRFSVKDLRWRRDGLRLTIEAPDHAFSTLMVNAGSEEEAQRWAARLNI